MCMCKLRFVLLLTIVIVPVLSSSASGFNYQGELLDDGSPANGYYDIKLSLFNDDNVQLGSDLEFISVFVDNGLFFITPVDFGDQFYFMDESLWIQVSVKKSGDNDEYNILTPRQKIETVPFAVKSDFSFMAQNAIEADFAENAIIAEKAITATSLEIAFASEGDVLRFNGSDWVPGPEIFNSYWESDDNDDIRFNGGNVGIGVIDPMAGLTINTENNISPLFVKYNGELNLLVSANGTTYVKNITVNDDALIQDNLLVKGVSDLRGNLTVGGDGTPGSGTLQVVPAGSLVHVEGIFSVLGNAFVDDLTISNDINISGESVVTDITQEIDSFGIPKLAVDFTCNLGQANGVTYFSHKSRFGYQNASLTSPYIKTIDNARCELEFPDLNLNNHYWTLSVRSQGGNNYVTCDIKQETNDTLVCRGRSLLNPSSSVSFRANMLIY